MPNFIPPTSHNSSSSTRDEFMTRTLRSQFRMLQRMHDERQTKVTNSKNMNISKPTFTDASGQTLSIDHAALQASSPAAADHIRKHDWSSGNDVDDQVTLQMAISTAITAQNEIDVLMNGIQELETVVNANQAVTLDSSVQRGLSSQSSLNARGSKNCAAVVDGFEV